MLPSVVMTKKEYIARMHKMFAYHGFTSCPLSLGRLGWMWEVNIPEERAYRIGCDVAADVPFLTAVAENR